MKKILTVLGARPQFVKASMVSRAFMQTDELNEVIVHTGQHFDTNMSDVFFNELDMKNPKYFLGINGGGHGAMTGRMLEDLEKVMVTEEPDAVLVYGDTNSTLAGALAAAKLHIPVAHVEAGLRSFNLNMPEELNRKITDCISKWLFTPTNAATQHLMREGIDPNAIEEVGDVMNDVAMYQGSRVNSIGRVLERLNLSPGSYVLATIHRAENTNDIDRLKEIVVGLETVSEIIPVIWPMHPRTRNVCVKMGLLSTLSDRILIIDPVGYLDMIQLEKYASVIATDSGGVQKEAFFFRVPCVTLRNETEWVELIESCWNRLVPPYSSSIIAKEVLDAMNSKGVDTQPYGNGDAANKIVKRLARDLI